MKIIAIGDTHGRTNWEKIVEKEKDADKIVFVGDYFDTHEHTTGAEQMENFKNIIAYKEAHKDQIVLLMGNHDFHYLPVNEQYSGYQPHLQHSFYQLINDAMNKRLVKFCWLGDNILFSHAGVTETWRKNNNVPLNGIDSFINRLPMDAFKFNRADFSGYGQSVLQSPIWVRPESLLTDPCAAYRQVVGHTTMEQIQIKTPICFIDTVGVSGQYLQIEDGELTICN